ncbi:glycosyl transferase family 1 [Acinetobacter calcoaceticus]|uniref:Glycosyl transferase family 1 n=1 Tax=Acinetobacter calcoaceticus TaxID=471 RepID=A0A4R1XV14_ACICA|nr:glycosyl transferase family 1 [Acinetobacter calcoaceticus]
MGFYFGTQAASKLNILCVLDPFSSQMLAYEPNITLEHANPNFLPLFYKHYDFLLVESAWLGQQNKWRHRVASYPDHQERNNHKLAKLVQWAKDKKIPTIFWNKEDPFHFEQFIDSAKLFDYIFTTDASIVERYQQLCPDAQVAALSFPFQPKIHFPSPLEHIVDHSSIFIGSYMRHMHSERQQWQDMCFKAAAPYGLTIVDRHAHLARTQEHYKFPVIDNIDYCNAVEYSKTAAYYHQHQQALNVNTVTSSPTMYSRRLIEIMACNRLAISNPSLAIEQHFPDMCETISHSDQADALFEQLQYGYTADQIEKVNTAREHVFQHYTVRTWLKNMLQHCQIDHPYLTLNK